MADESRVSYYQLTVLRSAVSLRSYGLHTPPATLIPNTPDMAFQFRTLEDVRRHIRTEYGVAKCAVIDYPHFCMIEGVYGDGEGLHRITATPGARCVFVLARLSIPQAWADKPGLYQGFMNPDGTRLETWIDEF